MAFLVGGTWVAKDQMSQQFGKFFQITEVVSVQSEVNSIAKFVYTDSFDDSIPAPDHFSAYIRARMHAREKRDSAKDFWGTEYKLEVNPQKILIRSAGPDKTYQNTDDIVAVYHR